MGRTPLRDEDGSHQCRCIIIYPIGGIKFCENTVPSSDVPFCEMCEDRHPDALLGHKITAW